MNSWPHNCDLNLNLKFKFTTSAFNSKRFDIRMKKKLHSHSRIGIKLTWILKRNWTARLDRGKGMKGMKGCIAVFYSLQSRRKHSIWMWNTAEVRNVKVQIDERFPTIGMVYFIPGTRAKVIGTGFHGRNCDSSRSGRWFIDECAYRWYTSRRWTQGKCEVAVARFSRFSQDRKFNFLSRYSVTNFNYVLIYNYCWPISHNILPIVFFLHFISTLLKTGKKIKSFFFSYFN